MGNKASKKGYVAIPATDPKTGAKFYATVKKGGKIHNQYLAQIKKLQKANRQQLNDFKFKSRQAKRAIPADQRANVNWSQVQTVLPSEGADLS